MIKQLALATALLLSLPVAATSEWSEPVLADDSSFLYSSLQAEDGSRKFLALNAYPGEGKCGIVFRYLDFKDDSNEESSSTPLDLEVEITVDNTNVYNYESVAGELTLSSELTAVSAYFATSLDVDEELRGAKKLSVRHKIAGGSAYSSSGHFNIENISDAMDDLGFACELHEIKGAAQ